MQETSRVGWANRAIGCADDRRRIIRERCASLCSAHPMALSGAMYQLDKAA